MSTTTTTRVIINITDTSGGGSPPTADPENEEEIYLPTAYEAVDFFVEFEFLIEETTESQNEDGNTEVQTFPATSVETDFDFDQYNIAFTKINDYKVRIEGPINNAFPDQSYQFVLPDMTTPILPFDTQEEFYSLIKYEKPAKNFVELEYDFLVNDSFDVSIFHIIVWRYQTAVNNINNLVQRGLV